MRNDAIIVAGGWTISGYDLRDLEQHGEIIGVNDSALFTKASIAVTRDRLWLESRAQMLKTLGIPEVWVHEGIVKNVALSGFVNRYKSVDSVEKIATKELFDSNSATAALSLALHWEYDRVFLLGFDMQLGPNNEAHWYPDYPWDYTTKPGKFVEWVPQYDAFAKAFKDKGIEVFNVNSHSNTKLTQFPIIPYTDFLKVTA